MQIKAIETQYAGCRFRSRLEARWAVFFDTLGIEWQYEPQGVEVDDARYLPDFFLTDIGVYVEVKAVLSHRDMLKMAKAVPGLRPDPGRQIRPTLLLLGPVPRPGECWCHVVLSTYRSDLMWHEVFFDDGSGTWMLKTFDQPISFGSGIRDDATEEDTAWVRSTWVESARIGRLRAHPDVDDALRAARSARFEFGESG